MKTQFNLSEKILKGKTRREVTGLLLLNVKDVEEFIRRIANLALTEHQWNEVKKLAGDKLI